MGRSSLEALWPWAAEMGQQLKWILERGTVNYNPRAVEWQQSKEESMKGQWAGTELYIKMGYIAVVGRLVNVLSDPHSSWCP